MKSLLFIALLTLSFITENHAQIILNAKAPEVAIDTTAEVLGFAESSNCWRFSFSQSMPGEEGRVQLETSGTGSAYVYSGGEAVVRFSVSSCSQEDGYYILNLKPNEQQGSIDPVYRIILVPNGNYACGYSPIVFDFGDDIAEQLYCGF